MDIKKQNNKILEQLDAIKPETKTKLKAVVDDIEDEDFLELFGSCL